MKKGFCFLSFLFCLKILQAQCPGVGQNPASALPVCGTAVFNQTTVPACGGNKMVTKCNDGVTYIDYNPYYYKFRCIIAGQLEFKITPITISEDYDWQLYDVTGRNPDDIYTDASLIVAYNWSEFTGVTGTSLSSSVANSCAGKYNQVSKAPMLILGHDYILMVSNFSQTSSGYNLTFSTLSASFITDLTVPKIDTVTASCGGREIGIKLSKKIRCSSIAGDASDFTIGNSPVLAHAVGVGCNAGFDTDSINVSLANALPNGSYIFNVTTGSDGNTLLDFCDNGAVGGANAFTIKLYQKPGADFSFTEKAVTCDADTLVYTHNGNNATDKWLWTFDGNPTSSTNKSQEVVYNSFNSRVVKLVVSNPLCTDSIVKNIPITDHTLIPKIQISRDTSCPNILQTFTDKSVGKIISRFWDFDNGQTSVSPNPPSPQYPVLPNNTIYKVKLITLNAIGCKDSTIKDFFVRGTIPTEFDSIIPPTCAASEVKVYFRQDMVCSSVAADGSDFVITNGPIGINILGANINCANGVGTVVTLLLDKNLITGKYNISIRQGTDGDAVINDCGIETLPKTLSFKALGHVNANIAYTAQFGCKKDSITFHHTANNFTNSWQWYFIDGSPNIDSSNIQNPKVIYSNVTDTHTVKLIAGNGVCFDTSIQKVIIIDHTAKAVIISPDTTCGGNGTTITDSSYVRIKKWNWYFGNGDSSKLQNPFPVVYPALSKYKTYTIRLIVENDLKCVDTTTKNIVARTAVPSSFTRFDYAKCSPDSMIVSFDFAVQCNTVAANGTDFTITGAGIVNIVNAYGLNCVNGLSKQVVLKFAQPINNNGKYTISIVKGTDGNSVINDCNLESPLLRVDFLAYSKVDAAFSNNVKPGCASDTLHLQNISTNNIEKWSWYVNNNLVNQSDALNLFYKTNTNYNVKLIVNNKNCADTFIQNFTQLFDGIKANFTVNNDIICPTETLIAQDNSKGNITSRIWNLGNGTTFNGVNSISYKYPLPNLFVNPTYGPINTGDNYNSYKVTLIVGNTKPCYDTVSKDLKVTTNCLISVPSAFTPNGDLLNDYLYPLNSYKALNLNFKVYSREGKLLFEAKDNVAKWDGKNYLKQPQPPGTYVWTLEYTDKDTGEKINMKGTSVLIR